MMEKSEDVISEDSQESVCKPEKFAENGRVSAAIDHETLVMAQAQPVHEQEHEETPGSPTMSETTGKRKVSFPESIVSRTFDPVDPWEHAGGANREEVINAYKEVCSRLKIKPCDKLMKQLEAYENFQDRVDVIDLRDMKLDSKSCEALEEVFRRVRVKTLDLENANLEDEGAVALFEMIEFYQTTNRLNLAFNPKIKTRGWQVCTRMLKRTPCIEYLDVRQTNWADQTIPLLGRALRVNCPLCVLHMEACNLSGRPLFMLANALKFNQILRDLFIGDNKLVSSDGTSLMAMLKCNGNLQLLDLRNNLLQDNGFGAICDGLSEQRNGPGLGTLVIWNNQLTAQSMTYLSNALAYTRNLHTINLGHNRVGNEGMRQLQPGLLRNQSLQRLGLLNTKITSEGAVALAEFVADSRTILRLDLRENELYVAGLMAISLALKVNMSLVRIDLDKEMKKEQGMETTQRGILADIYNYCQRNKNLSLERKQFVKTDSCDSNHSEKKTSNTYSNLNNIQSKQSNHSSHNPKQTEYHGTFSGPVAKFFSGPFASRFKITRIWEHSSDSREASKNPACDIGPSGTEDSSDNQDSPDESVVKYSDVKPTDINQFLEVSIGSGEDDSEKLLERIVDISTLEDSINDTPVLDSFVDENYLDGESNSQISSESIDTLASDSGNVIPIQSPPELIDTTSTENSPPKCSAPDQSDIEDTETLEHDVSEPADISTTNLITIPVVVEKTQESQESSGLSSSPDDFEKELDAMLAGVHVDGSYKGQSVDDIVDEELWDNELEKLLKGDDVDEESTS